MNDRNNKLRMKCEYTKGTSGKKCRTIEDYSKPMSGSSPYPPRPSSRPWRPVKSTLSPERQKAQELEKFYRNYNPMEGVLTAVVLGGFFAFVCLLVVYKTKCKPMWKNRKKRLTNTPASEANNGSFRMKSQKKVLVQQQSLLIAGDHPDRDLSDGDDEDEGGMACMVEDESGLEFECIPLRSIFASDCDPDDPGAAAEADDDDIFFMDEFGNYVFPLPSEIDESGHAIPGSGCSCPGSADISLASAMRRQSQASALSAAYTVKSLPGAYLYIPLMQEETSLSLSSIRRSLSDPEIHFSPPVTQPIILTVNHEGGNIFFGSSFGYQGPLGFPRQSRHPAKFQQRSHSIQPGATGLKPLGSHGPPQEDDLDNDLIAIQVIQPTPNISPSCSLRSFSGDLSGGGSSISHDSGGSMATLSVVTPPSPIVKHKGKVDRRVSFSEDESSACDEGSNPKPHQLSRGNIPFMNYLQVPGQPPASSLSFVVPSQLSPDAQLAQTSSPARRRRATRLMKAGSFCSIQDENEESTNVAAQPEAKQPRFQNERRYHGHESDDPSKQASICVQPQSPSVYSRSSSDRKLSSPMIHSSLDPLSDYIEFKDECCSDISELFADEDSKDHKADEKAQEKKGELKNQGTLSDQEGSIQSLSIDQEDVSFEPPTSHQCPSTEDDEKTFGSSEAATIVTTFRKSNVQSPPVHNPEYDQIMQEQHFQTFQREGNGSSDADDDFCIDSSSCSISIGSNNGHESHQHKHQITVPVTIEHPPPDLRDSSPDTESDVGNVADVGAGKLFAPSGAAGLVRQETVHTDSGLDTEEIVPVSCSSGINPNQEGSDGSMQMVLVRDIGVQVCGDSPNLNMTRKYHEINPMTTHHYGRSKSVGHHEDEENPDGGGGVNRTSKQQTTSFSTEILF